MKRVGKRASRSLAGDIALFAFLGLMAFFMVLPMVYTISNAFKPLDEIWEFPPRFLVRNPTFDNFKSLGTLVVSSWVPFSRYVFNTLIVTAAGTFLHILAASMAAYQLAKGHFPGRRLIFGVVVTSLMFAGNVTAIPNYLIMSRLGLVDTLLAIILPAVSMPLGLFLMKQFMEGVPDSVIESARVDGANSLTILWRIVLPMVRPAWLTLMLFSFQALWGNGGGNFIYSEEKKLLPYAMSQVLAGGVARTGAAYAASLIMLVVPVLIFVVTQSNVIETMSSSGIKE